MKKVLIIVITGVFLIAACGFGIYKYEKYQYIRRTYPQTMAEALDVDYLSIDKIMLRNGNNGKFAIVTDKKSIQQIIDKFKGVRLKLEEISGIGHGYAYAMGLYHSGEDVGGFIYNEDCVIIGKYDKEYIYKPSFDIDSESIAKLGTWHALTDWDKYQ